jgi:hypothetical protein
MNWETEWNRSAQRRRDGGYADSSVREISGSAAFAKKQTTELNKRNGGTEEGGKSAVKRQDEGYLMIISWLSSVPPFLLFNFSLSGRYPSQVGNEKTHRERRGAVE